MTNQSQQLLIAALKEMITYCQGVHELLKGDGERFAKNQIDSIEDSNKKKMEFIAKLSDLVTQLSTSHPKGLMEQIKESKENTSLQDELHLLTEQLNEEIMGCSRYLEINSSIIYTNLKILKDIWDKLIVLKSKNNIYDEAGNIVAT